MPNGSVRQVKDIKKAHACFRYAMVIAAIAMSTAVARGRLVAVASDAPVDEAVTKVSAWINAHPKDGEGCRVLGRIHALAWAYGDKIPLVGSARPGALPVFAETSTVLVSRTGPGEMRWNPGGMAPPMDRKERPVTAEDALHLTASIAAYRKAIELDAHDALSELGLGWMLAQQGIYARDLPADYWADPKPADAETAAWARAIAQLADQDFSVREVASQTLLAAMPRCVLTLRSLKSGDPESNARISAVLRGYFELQALAHYRKAFDLRATQDLAGNPTFEADSPISAMAGAQMLAVWADHPEAASKEEIQAVQKVVEPLAKKKEQLLMGDQ